MIHGFLHPERGFRPLEVENDMLRELHGSLLRNLSQVSSETGGSELFPGFHSCIATGTCLHNYEYYEKWQFFTY